MTARVQQANQDQREVFVVGCLIEKQGNGLYSYTVTNSPMPAEVAWMAAYEVSRQMRPK